MFLYVVSSLWLLPDVGGLRDEEDNEEDEDAEEDCADAEGPFVAEILDDVAADKGSSSNTAKQKQVPHGDSGAALMDKVHVADGCLNKNLIPAISFLRVGLMGSDSDLTYGAIANPPTILLPRNE